MKIPDSPGMRKLDAQAIQDIGIPSIVLMENAARGAARFLSREFPFPQYHQVLVAVGKGNNGGDGLAAGRILAQQGYQVLFLLVSEPSLEISDHFLNFQIIQKLHLPYRILKSKREWKRLLDAYHNSDTFLIDALLGTGISHPVTQGTLAEIIPLINDSGLKIAALDIPSGLSEAFLPGEGAFIKAQVTATFQFIKQAHIHPDGHPFCGKIQVIDIGIPVALSQKPEFFLQMIESRDLLPLFAPREISAHKGNFGHALSIAGSLEKPGAGILSAYSALKIGAGLVTAAVLPENRSLMIQSHPEIMTLIFQTPEELWPRLGEFTSLLMGPGLGNTETTRQLVKMLLDKVKVPLIIDADAINALQGHSNWLKQNHPQPWVLTPHPGEFARICGVTREEIQKNRIPLARDFAVRFRVYLILKGHHSLLATPEGQVFLNPTGNPGMATAGSGDVLSGIVLGLIAQFHSQFPLETILQAAIFIHGYAGDLAIQKTSEMGLIASDLIRYLPAAMQKIHEYRSPFEIA